MRGDDALEQACHGQDGMEPDGFRVVFLLVFRGTEIGDFEADIPITVLESGGSCQIRAPESPARSQAKL
jgi:hypothetical protein